MSELVNYVKPNADMFNNMFLEQVKIIVDNYFNSKPLFDDSYKLYYYDEYMLDTYVASTATATIYLEINAPDNFKQNSKGESFKFNQDKLRAPKLYLSLKTIKDNLYSILLKTFNSDCTIWKTKYGVAMSTYDEDEEGNKTFYKFQILPCLTYVNKKGVKGVIYYNDYNAEICVDYPKLSLINFRIKERQTNFNYGAIVKNIKNLYMQQSKEIELPTEIYETMVYNVPNDMLKNSDLKTTFNIIKYLNKKALNTYKTIDEQDNALATSYRLMSAVYVKHVLKVLTNKFLS